MAEAFIDTSFVVALINQRDQYHAQAVELASQFDKRSLVTTDAVLLEIGNALARNFKEASIQIIEYFLTSDEVELIPLTLNCLLEHSSFIDRTSIRVGALSIVFRSS